MSAPKRPACPRPDKRVFRDRIAAALHATRDAPLKSGQPHHGLDNALKPYRCPAGHWHLRSVHRKADPS
jgi:hypothetical protein